MDQDTVTRAFGVISEEIKAIIHELNDEGAHAFRSGRYEDVDRLRHVGEELAVFRGSVGQLQTLWVSKFLSYNGNTTQPKPVRDQPMPILDEPSFPIPEEPATGEGTGLLGRLDHLQ